MPIRPFTTRPELGHKPARVGIGVGWRNDESFEEMTLRAGYHDLLDPDPGYVPYAQIELLGLSVRHYNKRNRTRLETLSLANIVSLTPVDRLIKAFSWKIRLNSTKMSLISIKNKQQNRNSLMPTLHFTLNTHH